MRKLRRLYRGPQRKGTSRYCDYSFQRNPIWNSKDNYSATALWYAVERGSSAIARLSLEKQCQLRSREEWQSDSFKLVRTGGGGGKCLERCWKRLNLLSDFPTGSTSERSKTRKSQKLSACSLDPWGTIKRVHTL